MKNTPFPEIKGNFGFGCMRLPEKDGGIDLAAFSEMADAFLAVGFNYFDTAHGYHDGLSEPAIRECVAKRYPRDRFVLTDKLTDEYFSSQEEIRPFFEKQLALCGVEYFDFYLMHAQNAAYFEKFKRCRAYETALELKKEGKIRHFGISFHDGADVLERILSEYPEIETVQLQINYADFDDPAVQGRACAEVCKRHRKPVIVMEPVKGGILARLPEAAEKVLRAGTQESPARFAIRYAASCEQVYMVLSGVSNMAQTLENVGFMKDFRPFTDEERELAEKVAAVFRGADLIPCTACRYCTAGCPKNISIPDLFSDMNAKTMYGDWNSDWYYGVHTGGKGRARDCIGCGKCERACPQHLPIRELLKKVSETFDREG